MTKRAVIITSSVLVAIMMTITILFGVVFRVRDIDIKYSNDFYYKEQIDDILSASKLKKNTSIFEINRDEIENNIEKAYPYASVSVNLSSLTSIKITLSTRVPLYYFVQESVYYILDENCKILELTTDSDIATKYIKLDNVFSATESTKAGEFLTNKYTLVCKDLYNALYSNAMIEKLDDKTGEYIDAYLEREDMCNIITSIKFSQQDELNGRVDKLNITTSYGVKISIIEPQKDLDNKINRVFSAFRVLQERDRENATSLLQSGSINLIYAYDDNGTVSVICEYRV